MTDESYPLARAAKRFAVAAVLVVLARTALTDRSPRDSIGLATVLGAGVAGADYALWRYSRDEPATTIEMDDQQVDVNVDADGAGESASATDTEEQPADD